MTLTAVVALILMTLGYAVASRPAVDLTFAVIDFLVGVAVFGTGLWLLIAGSVTL